MKHRRKNSKFSEQAAPEVLSSMANQKSTLTTVKWSDIIGLTIGFLCLYQYNSMSKALFLQETRISELEKIVNQVAFDVNNTLLNTKVVKVKEQVHAPHSQYNIKMVDGIPEEIDRRYHHSDFQTFFNVEPIYLPIETPEATELLDKNFVSEEENYRLQKDSYGPLLGPVADWFKNYKSEDSMSMYIKWESRETGFGLYAHRAFQRGEIVDLYTGELYLAYSHLDTNLDTDYTWEYPSKTGKFPPGATFGVDGKTKGNYLRFANHVGEHSNTKAFFVPYKNRWWVFYIAVKNIAVDDAMTSDYGSEYFEERPLVV